MATSRFACVACFASAEVPRRFEHRDGISRKPPRQLLPQMAWCWAWSGVVLRRIAVPGAEIAMCGRALEIVRASEVPPQPWWETSNLGSQCQQAIQLILPYTLHTSLGATAELFTTSIRASFEMKKLLIRCLAVSVKCHSSTARGLQAVQYCKLFTTIVHNFLTQTRTFVTYLIKAKKKIQWFLLLKIRAWLTLKSRCWPTCTVGGTWTYQFSGCRKLRILERLMLIKFPRRPSISRKELVYLPRHSIANSLAPSF